METKPARPERDRHIAELRGDEPWCIDCDDSPISACWKEHSVDFKPYSTDTATSMKLWEEMVKAGLMPVLRTIWIDHGEIGYRMIIGDKHGETHEGWSIADAISGAYEKWKGRG